MQWVAVFVPGFSGAPNSPTVSPAPLQRVSRYGRGHRDLEGGGTICRRRSVQKYTDSGKRGWVSPSPAAGRTVSGSARCGRSPPTRFLPASLPLAPPARMATEGRPGSPGPALTLPLLRVERALRAATGSGSADLQAKKNGPARGTRPAQFISDAPVQARHVGVRCPFQPCKAAPANAAPFRPPAGFPPTSCRCDRPSGGRS